MPKDYSLDKTPANAQRLPKYAQDEAWIKAFLERAHIGHIATRWEQQPFITPTTFWYDPLSHAIYFHSNVVGRLRANSECYPEVCFEAFEVGKPLPSNVALEFSIQYESVIAFGKIRVLEDFEHQRRVLYGLIGKYFPRMVSGEHYRPITDTELKRTSVYAIAIESWSGKRNWKDRASQSDEWPALAEEWFE
jgi:nitroimidazol reductase NimA-like FMN-containing flavoprotein (pyridoxamine 5'-phosphate oxidase superfamily)